MNEAIQTREEILALLKTFLESRQAEYRLTSIGVFGSFARGEARGDSDVDVVFETNEPNLFRTAMMKQGLEELLGRSVEVLQLRGLTNPRLKARIERDAVYV